MKLVVIAESDRRIIELSPEDFKQLLIAAFEDTKDIERAVDKVSDYLKKKTLTT